jgi:hypothetical protein
MNKTVLLLVPALVATACIVKRDEGSGYYDTPTPSEARSCARHEQCTVGCFCDPGAGRCRPSETCHADADCEAGFRCDARSTCIPREPAPARDAGPDLAERAFDAQSLGGGDAGTSCDAGAAGTGTCAPRCRFDQQCGPGARCQEGHCQRPCTGPTFCGTGDVCREGFCQPDGQSGGQCVYSPQCPSAGTCINGTCHPGCDRDLDCPNHADVCDRGVCRPDERPLPPCTGNAQCAAGASCVDGLCRPGCGCDADCAPWGARAVCAHGFCMAPEELTGAR